VKASVVLHTLAFWPWEIGFTLIKYLYFRYLAKNVFVFKLWTAKGLKCQRRGTQVKSIVDTTIVKKWSQWFTVFFLNSIRWLLASNTVAWIQSQGRSCWICDGRSGTGQVIWVIQFPLPIFIPLNIPHSSITILGWYNRSNSGKCTKWTEPHTTQQIKKKIK
jgi:hypothetical protein